MNYYINSFTVAIKRLLLFLFSLAIIFAVYWFLVPLVWRNTPTLFGLIIVWFLTAYFALPRVHRLLSRFYVPDNFIGRVRTADGLLADPVNVAFIGSQQQLIAAMSSAGWLQADPITLPNVWKTIRTNLLRQRYATAPMFTYFMFGNPQDLSFQMEGGGKHSQRHHIRFWRVPKDWYLPGGHKVDWIGANTYEEGVRFSRFTMQFSHKIDANVDKERDFIVATLKKTGHVQKAEKINHFFNAYSSRNGDGHHYITDGSMVIVTLKKGK